MQYSLSQRVFKLAFFKTKKKSTRLSHFVTHVVEIHLPFLTFDLNLIIRYECNLLLFVGRTTKHYRTTENYLLRNLIMMLNQILRAATKKSQVITYLRLRKDLFSNNYLHSSFHSSSRLVQDGSVQEHKSSWLSMQ